MSLQSRIRIEQLSPSVVSDKPSSDASAYKINTNHIHKTHTYSAQTLVPCTYSGAERRARSCVCVCVYVCAPSNSDVYGMRIVLVNLQAIGAYSVCWRSYWMAGPCRVCVRSQRIQCEHAPVYVSSGLLLFHSYEHYSNTFAIGTVKFLL